MIYNGKLLLANHESLGLGFRARVRECYINLLYRPCINHESLGLGFRARVRECYIN